MHRLSALGSHVHWLIRLCLSATFIVHGLPKIPPDHFVEVSGLPLIVGWLVGVGEVGAGTAIVVGAMVDERLTQFAGLIIVIIMVGAIVLVHAENGWSIQNRGMEFQALLLAAGMLFLTKGNKV